MSPSSLVRTRLRTLIVASTFAVSVALALIFTSQLKAAGPIVVNSTSDVVNPADGLCSLPEAINAANTNTASGVAAGECAAGGAGTDNINIAVTGSILLNGPLPAFVSNITLTGPGPSHLEIKVNSGFARIFDIKSGTVSISGVTAGPGLPDVVPGSDDGTGGGIRVASTLVLNDVVVTGNKSKIRGGGIANTGNLTMTNCSVTGNSTTNDGTEPGGGIYNTGTLNMTNCIVSGNATGHAGNDTGNGGGIFNSGPMTLVGTTISNNGTGGVFAPATVGKGAGLFNLQVGASFATLINCTVSGNATGLNSVSVRGSGGGIENSDLARLNLIGTTVNGNTGTGGAGVNNLGKVIAINSTISGNNGTGINDPVDGSSMLLTNCTITANTGSGAANLSGVSPASTARNCIFAGNTGSDIDGTWTSQGHNLIGSIGAASGFVDGINGDRVGTSGSPLDPHLGPLANNGGLTMTHALLSNSTAIDAGDNCVVQAAHCGDSNISQLTTDQRGAGFNRNADGPDVDAIAAVDIGAYEIPSATLADTSSNEDTQLQVSFDPGDTSTISSVTASSGNATVVPDGTGAEILNIVGAVGLVTINPAANASGTTLVTVTVNRTVGGPDIKTFTLTVNPVNDAPSFTVGADQTVTEDAGAQSIAGWATGISAGPADESGQTLTFEVTGNTNAPLFSVAPAVDSSGALTYTPAANANGSATITIDLKDNGGTANGGVDTSTSQTFTVTVTAVNDAPSFIKGADQTVNEDAAAQSVPNWATAISRGPADESGQTLTFQVTNNTNASLFSVAPAVSSTGTLTYTPAANANGSATITINLKDNGGTANGGVDTSASQTFAIVVNAVNDAPAFTKGPNQTVNEDAGPQTVNNWATAISKGPADESVQNVTFQVTGNTNAALFSAGPAISSTGALTYTPAANANGSATITINLTDDGGTANGGVDTSASQTFTITVNPVNDAPSFTKGADQSASNTGGPQTVANWATNISAGPGNESSQTVTFQVTGNTNPSLFTAGPAVSSSGTLTYTPSTSAGGTATITLVGKDNGGTANGGVDTSAAQSFTITTVPMGGFFGFQSSSSNTTENSGVTIVNVIRSGNLSGPATVSYATNADSGVPCSTANGVASPKCDFTAALGTLSFAAGEGSKPITILISQDSFVEGPENITLTLSSPTAGAALGTLSTMSVTIADDATEPPTNIIDDANTFVRMHYHDFLNREADQSGLDFWTGQMTNCGNSDLTVCRVNVSGAFFLSIEFQQTGYLVERMYKTGYGDGMGNSQIGGSHPIFVPVVRANEFLADTQRVGRGVVVGQTGWETVLENNKQAYALEFVQTTRFMNTMPTIMTPAQFVDKLNQNAGGVLSVSERQAVLNLFGNSVNTANVSARAQAVRQVAEDADLFNAEANRAFVLTQYIGYLRRNPNDAPDSDYTGYDFWLGKLVQFNGNYVAAEMVKAFISSPEYRQRFGP